MKGFNVSNVGGGKEALQEGTICCTGVECSNRDINEDGGRMRTRVCNEGKIGSPRGVGRIARELRQQQRGECQEDVFVTNFPSGVVDCL